MSLARIEHGCGQNRPILSRITMIEPSHRSEQRFRDEVRGPTARWTPVCRNRMGRAGQSVCAGMGELLSPAQQHESVYPPASEPLSHRTRMKRSTGHTYVSQEKLLQLTPGVLCLTGGVAMKPCVPFESE